MVWFESQLIVERNNSLIATTAVAFQSALTTTAASKPQKAIDLFSRLIKELQNEP